MRRSVLGLCPAILALLTACGGSSVGETCKLKPGALGFGFDDPCRSKCLELEDVICPDGSTVRRAVCAGAEGCQPGSCPAGQLCYSFEDPFEEDFYCIPDDICGAPPAADLRLAWESASRERSEALRAKFQRLKDHRAGNPTSTPGELEPKPDPSQ